MNISFFSNTYAKEPTGKTSILQFVNEVKVGKWRQPVETISNTTNKEQRQELKKRLLPLVTISGTFEKRNKDGLIEHSGYICMDFDDLEDVDAAFNTLAKDRFSFATFKSASGKGIAVVVKIDKKKHLDAFLALESYYGNKYGLLVDRSGKDVTRLRYASYDPDAVINDDAPKFDRYLPKSQKIPATKLPRVITGRDDLDFILEQIHNNRVDLTGSEYDKFLSIGFALAAEYGEGGRSTFHAVTQYSHKYESKRADKQFSHCVKSTGHGVTFATFLFFCKEAGIAIVSPDTKHITTVAILAKKGDRGLKETLETLEKVDGIKPERSKEIVEKVFAREDIGKDSQLPTLQALEIWMNSNYNLKRNEITQYIECEGKEIDTTFVNSIYMRSLKEVDEKLKFDLVNRLIGSDFTPNYNPLKEFFESADPDTSGHIEKLANCIESPTGAGTDYVHRFLKKWLVGMVASVYGAHSPLLLIFTGEQQTGKTEFFRRLLPESLQEWSADSKLDAGKDDEILMCKKLLIIDDEMSGKSKNDAKKLKELTSKDWFTLREPYGQKNVRLKRLAVLAGTANEDGLLNDPTGNRRLIPVTIEAINHGEYNSIDKTLLLHEAYNEYKNGYSWELSREDVQFLNEHTTAFEAVSPEREIIQKCFHPPGYNPIGSQQNLSLSTSEVYVYLMNATNKAIKLTHPKLDAEMKRAGYQKLMISVDGVNASVYNLIPRENQSLQADPERNADGSPVLGESFEGW